jgi:hypothetical protein
MSIATVTTLPPELLEHIFSYVVKETTCLSTCSLVCHAWSDVAQSVLCRDSSLYLRRLPWTDPNQMQDISAIIPLFHQLIISSFDFSFADTLETFERKVDSHDHIHLTFESTYSFESAALKNVAVRWDRAAEILSNITVVHISGVKFTNLAALRHVLGGLPALERLKLHGARMHHAGDLPSWNGLRLRSLKSYLRADEAIIRALLTWLATAEDPRLEELCLRYLVLCEPVREALRGVLVTCVQSLRTLEVDASGCRELIFVGASSI